MRIGEVSRAVHLVQFGLLDLGFAMPRSTGRQRSPDAIFGQETEAVVKAFQRRERLTEDGLIGRRTMARLDQLLANPGHRVRLHFIAISMSNVSFESAFRNTRRVYQQYGIDMAYSTGQSLDLDKQHRHLFQNINQRCEWNLTDGDFALLHSLGPQVPADQIRVYFVNRIAKNLLGCGGHAPNRPAVTVARAAWRWDLAHEIGHVLLTRNFSPVHHPQIQNLMHEAPPDDANVKILTRSQVLRMRRHPCCRALCSQS